MACGGVSKEGVRILQPESIELMKQDLLNDVTHQEIIQKMGRLGYGYGCGVQVLMEPELLHSKAPAGIFGWDGAAGSLLIMDTATKRVRHYGFTSLFILCGLPPHRRQIYCGTAFLPQIRHDHPAYPAHPLNGRNPITYIIPTFQR